MANQLHFQMPRLPDGTVYRIKTLEEAIRERDEFLDQNPSLINFQEEIDRRLSKAGTCENRMAVLGMMMEANMTALHNHLSYLLKALK